MPITLSEAYEVLELPDNAPEDAVKKAYKKLALKTHPDKNPDDPEANKKFLRISEAYKRITDPESFREEEGEDDLNEEEMTAMFSSMFADMMGSFGFEYGNMNGSIPSEVFEIMEQMMMHEVMGSMMSNGAGGSSFMDMDQLDSDDDEEFIRDMLIFESLTGIRPGKAKKSSNKKSSSSRSSKKKSSASVGDDEWETDYSDDDDEDHRHKQKVTSKSKSAKNNVLQNLKYFDIMEDDDDDDDDDYDDELDDLDIMAAMMMQMGMDLPGGGVGGMDLEEMMMLGIIGNGRSNMQSKGSNNKTSTKKLNSKTTSKKPKPSQGKTKKMEGKTKSTTISTPASAPDAKWSAAIDSVVDDTNVKTKSKSNLAPESTSKTMSSSTQSSGSFKADGKPSTEIKNSSSSIPAAEARASISTSTSMNENHVNSNLNVALGDKVLVQNRYIFHCLPLVYHNHVLLSVPITLL